MLKITAIISLVLIVTWSQAYSRSRKNDDIDSSHYHSGSVWSSGLSCESCGSECMSACGTRHFRACCFNYLRKKRGNVINDGLKIWSTKNREDKNALKKLPFFAIDNTPEMTYLTPFLLPNEYEPSVIEDTERLQLIEA